MTVSFRSLRVNCPKLIGKIGSVVIILFSTFILIELSARVYFASILHDPAIMLAPFLGKIREEAIASIFPSQRQNGYLNYPSGPLEMYVASQSRPVQFTLYKTIINSLGFRGGEILPRSQPGELRIVCLGESSTFGFLLRDEDTYPARLQEILSRDLNRPVKVYNLAVSESTTDWQLNILSEYLDRADPDIVTFYGSHNDIRDMIFKGRVAPTLLNRMLITTRIFKARGWFGFNRLTKRDDLPPDSFDKIHANLAAMAVLLKNKNIKFYFILQRIIHSQAREGKSYAEFYEFLLAQRKKSNVIWNRPQRVAYWHYQLLQSIIQAKLPAMQVIDPMPDLDRDDFLTHVHPSQSGAEKIARAVAAGIAKDFKR